jgi:hypothetical protein
MFLAIERLLEVYREFRGRLCVFRLRSRATRISRRTANSGHVADRVTRRFGGDHYKPMVLLEAMRTVVAEFNAYRWVGAMLRDAALLGADRAHHDHEGNRHADALQLS